MDTKKLRQKILDLAIHGKLVPQDPNDESASVLLERIKAEKEQLIKDGKIKRQKKATSSDTPHYGNDVPDGWCFAPMSELFILNPKNDLSDDTQCGFVPMALVNEGFSGKHTFEVKKWELVKRGFCHFKNGDIGVAKISPCFENLKSVIFSNLPNACGAGTTELAVLRGLGVYPWFYLYLFKSSWYISEGTKYFKGVVGQQRVNKEIFTDLIVPVPPLNEQIRISKETERLFDIIDSIDKSEMELRLAVQLFKNKVLELSLKGKLTSHTSHYQQLPKGWELKALEDVLDYEQPQKYIVDSTDYSDSYTTPVLTAGKSFVIGYTNEVSGIFTDVPVIIFDDFTTDSKYVNFPFKVKSSAMKILHPREGINLKYVTYFMSVTQLAGKTHKRYWISEYSKIMIPIPPKDEQDRIVSIVEQYYSLIDNIL